MEQKRAILHSRLFIIKRESVKEEDKCENCRRSVRGHQTGRGKRKVVVMVILVMRTGRQTSEKQLTQQTGFGSFNLMLNNSSSSLSVSSAIRVTKSCNREK